MTKLLKIMEYEIVQWWGDIADDGKGDMRANTDRWYTVIVKMEKNDGTVLRFYPYLLE